ncbi:MAG: thiamine pyrophosphate-binding protein, partial [Candidatus Bathyarchaeia archaeon]
GYGRVSGKPGVLISTAGPGATNTVTAVAQAFVEGAPLILIAGGVSTRYFGKGQYHELRNFEDQLKIFEPVTKLAIKVKNVEEIPISISKAFAKSVEGKPGPIYIEVPIDVLISEGVFHEYQRTTPKLVEPDKELVKKTINLISSAKSPVIFAGGGIISSNTSGDLVELAEIVGAPVVTSIMGKGSISPDHPLYAGVANGNMGDELALKIVEESDLMLALGTRFSELGTGRWSLKVPETIIHVNIDENIFNKVYPATLAIKSDLRPFLKTIIKHLKARFLEKKIKRGVERIMKLREHVVEYPEMGYSEQRINYSDIIKALEKIVNNNTIVTCDAGWNQVALFQLKVYRPRSFLSPCGFNSLGYAIPAAVGAKIAKPSAEVIATVGDFGFLSTCIELATAVRVRANILTLIFNNGCQGVLTFHQKRFYGRTFATETHSVNFSKLAEAIGVGYIEITRREELSSGMEEGLQESMKRPVMVNIHVNPDALPQAISRLAFRESLLKSSK